MMMMMMMMMMMDDDDNAAAAAAAAAAADDDDNEEEEELHMACWFWNWSHRIWFKILVPQARAPQVIRSNIIDVPLCFDGYATRPT